MPGFLRDVVDDRRALKGLIAACVALAAAGLDPHVLDPGNPHMEALLRQDPSLQNLLTVSALAQAGLLLLGGAVADIWRSERLLSIALIGLAIASIGAVLVPSGTGLTLIRMLAWTCDGLIIPFSIATVAILYRGPARATALGALFGVYGATTAAAPFLVTAFGADGPTIQAFGLCAVVALVGVWLSRRYLPDMPGASREQRRLIAVTAVWAFGVIAIADGVLQVQPLPVITGLLIIAGAEICRRWPRRIDQRGVHSRRVAAALIAGLVVGFAQGVPMLVVPVYFTRVVGIDSMVATILIAPFVLGLLVAGPVAGSLLSRYRPGTVMLGGVLAIGLANLAFAVMMGPDFLYPVFVLPFVLVGGGFVVATVVRTAVIFASTPSNLPGTAAALNESSIGVGARLGTTFVILSRAFGEGTIVAPVEYDLTIWLRAATVVAGLVAIIGGVVVALLLGRHQSSGSVWDLQDERPTPGEAGGQAPAR